MPAAKRRLRTSSTGAAWPGSAAHEGTDSERSGARRRGYRRRRAASARTTMSHSLARIGETYCQSPRDRKDARALKADPFGDKPLWMARARAGGTPEDLA